MNNGQATLIGAILTILSSSIYSGTALQDDSIAARAILDSNGFYECDVFDINFTDTSGGRITDMSTIGPYEAYGRQFRSIPQELEQLDALDDLSLGWSSCSLDTLPEAVCRLPNLAILNLDRWHSLRELPACVGSMSSLQSMSAYRCSLTTLPPTIVNLGEIHLMINGNYLCDLDADIEAWIDLNNPDWDWRATQHCENGVVRPLRVSHPGPGASGSCALFDIRGRYLGGGGAGAAVGEHALQVLIGVNAAKPGEKLMAE